MLITFLCIPTLEMDQKIDHECR